MHGEGREQRREAGRAVAVLRKDLKEVREAAVREGQELRDDRGGWSRRGVRDGRGCAQWGFLRESQRGWLGGGRVRMWGGEIVHSSSRGAQGSGAITKICHFSPNERASLVAQMVKTLPATRETWVRSLGWEDPLEESMATHSSILAWKIPTDREAWGLQSMGPQRAGQD